MSNRLTDKQEAFVQAMLVPNTSQRAAYKKAYPNINMKESTIDSKASILMKSDKVKARFDDLKGKLRAKAEEEGILTAADVLKKVHDIILRNERADDKTALKALETYGKSLGIWIDTVEVKNEIVVVGDIDD